MSRRQIEGGPGEDRLERPPISTFPPDPSRCGCGGAVRSEPLETVCDSCGIVYDSLPLVVLPPIEEEGVIQRNEPIPKDGRATTLGRDKSTTARFLRVTERRTTSKASRVERSRARRWKAGRIVAERLGLPKSLREEVAGIVRDTKVLGRSYEAVACAAAIVVARKHSMPLGIREAGSVLGIPWPDIGRALRSLKRNNRATRVPPVSVSTLLIRVLGRLPRQLPAELRRWCLSAIKTLEDQPHRVSPQSLACVPLLSLSRSRLDLRFLTHAVIAHAAGLTEITVRNGGDVLDELGHLLTPIPLAQSAFVTPLEPDPVPRVGVRPRRPRTVSALARGNA